MSAKIVIKTTDRVVPMIYAYTTPEIARHNGWTKLTRRLPEPHSFTWQTMRNIRGMCIESL